jgi:hypothetical protein
MPSILKENGNLSSTHPILFRDLFINQAMVTEQVPMMKQTSDYKIL